MRFNYVYDAICATSCLPINFRYIHILLWVYMALDLEWVLTACSEQAVFSDTVCLFQYMVSIRGKTAIQEIIP